MIPEEIAGRFAGLPYVQAVVLSGSRTKRVDDGHSDFDMYVYTEREIPASWRAELAQQVEAMISASALQGQPELLTHANALLDSLDAVLLGDGLIAP